MLTHRKPNDYHSVQKALQILLAFVPNNSDMGTSEISARLGLHKSTVSRLLNVLTSYGFLQHDSKTRKFRLGISAAKISTAIKQSLSEHLIGIAQPHLDDLRNEIGEAVALEVWLGDGTIMAYRAEVLRLRRVFLLRPGDRVDIHISAAARVILAFLAPHVVDRVLQGPFERYTEDTIVDPNILKEQIRKARDQGFAISRSGRHPDSNIIAVPIFDYEKRPVAAISLFTTTERLPNLLEADIVSKLNQTASQISAKLLYSEEH
jgi:IclR family transcriptional regulator, KDG regulon repressor